MIRSFMETDEQIDRFNELEQKQRAIIINQQFNFQ